MSSFPFTMAKNKKNTEEMPSGRGKGKGKATKAAPAADDDSVDVEVDTDGEEGSLAPPPPPEKQKPGKRPGTSGTENLLITNRRAASEQLARAQRAEQTYRDRVKELPETLLA